MRRFRRTPGDQVPNPESWLPQAVISSGGVLGPVVEGFGLCNSMSPPANRRVVTTTAGAPVHGGLTPVIFTPNLSTPAPPGFRSFLSSLPARTFTVPQHYSPPAPH